MNLNNEFTLLRNIYQMNIKNYQVLVLLSVLIVSFSSCRPDDDNVNIPPPRDRTVQQVADKDSLINYLESHYYNSSFFETGTNHTIEDIVITELPTDDEGNYLDLPDPDNNTLLIDAVETLTTTYQDAAYEYYILRLNQGGGAERPYYTDLVRVRYEGSLVTDASVFDSAVTVTDFSLVQGLSTVTEPGVIRGWQLTLPEFNIAESFTVNSGVVEYNDYGLGVMFIPSGLGFFSGASTGLPSYSNLVFKFELLQFERRDHDGDGIISFLEDLNQNGDAFDDDTDNDGIPNYLDVDDDGDGVLTINEDIDEDGDPTNDIGANDIPKYLDPQETESNEDE